MKSTGSSSKRMTAVITGASSGIGQAAARVLASRDMNLVLIARRVEKLNILCDELTNKHNIQVLSLSCDVTDKNSVNAAVEAISNSFPEVSTLINNAGLALGLETADMCSIDDWETMIDTNIKGLLYVTHALVPLLKKHGSGASIVNIGSTAANHAYRGGNVYGGTKAFVQQFSLNLRIDLAGTGIRVTDIQPGIVETEFSLVRFKGDEQKAKSVYADKAPLQANDIAQTIGFVCDLPPHVNVTKMEVMPTSQIPNGFAFIT